MKLSAGGAILRQWHLARELSSKLLKRGYIGQCYRGYEGGYAEFRL